MQRLHFWEGDIEKCHPEDFYCVGVWRHKFLRRLDTIGKLFSIFLKGDNLDDFLFTKLHAKLFLKWDLI